MEDGAENDNCPFTPPSSPSRSSQQNGTSLSLDVGDASPSPSASGLQSRVTATINGRSRTSSSRGPFLIGVAGGTASGKTSVCRKIMEALEQVNSSNQRVVMISQDSFYKNLTRREIALANIGEYNFDHPGRPTNLARPRLHIICSVVLKKSQYRSFNTSDAFDTKLIEVTLKGILEGRTVQIPIYDFKTHSRYAPIDHVLLAIAL